MSLRSRSAAFNALTNCRLRRERARASSCEPLESRQLFAATTTLHDVADAYVRDGSFAGQNFGQATTLDEKLNTAAGYTRRSYLTFDTSSVSGNMSAAVVRVYGGLLETATMPVGIFAVPMTTWGESTINWNNKPATSGNAIATRNVTSTKQWFDYDVTAYVSAERAAGRKSVSFALAATQSTASALASFNSDEAASNRPELAITTNGTSPTPTPTPVPTLAGLTLVNSTNATDIGAFTGGDIISGAKVALRADPGSGVGSVKFVTDGGTPRIESAAPFTIAGDNGFQSYTQWTPAKGAHTLVVTPYAKTGATGTAGTPITVHFNVVDSPTPTPSPSPTGTPSLTAATGSYGVVVGAGKVTRSDGTVINVIGGTLNIDAPHVGAHTYTGVVPSNYSGGDLTLRAPDDAANLHPDVDTLMLGGLYRGVIPSSVVVKNAAGKVMTRDMDYKVYTEWGQVSGVNGRLGTPGSGNVTITYQSVDQRLDLIEVMPNGTLAVKKGTSAVVAPTLPAPDAGAVPLAGVFAYTLNGARSSGFVMEQRNIYPIKPAAPVAPVNDNTISKTLNKLRAGGNVTIAYFGDSITAGAEAGPWWRDRSKTYTDLTTAGLRARFPSATVNEIVASEFGKALTDSQGTFQTQVLDPNSSGQHVDLVVINLGMNDSGSPNLDASKAALGDYIDKARAAGIEVLVVTPIQDNPYYTSPGRVPRSQVAQAIKDVALAKDAALMDMYTEWVNQGTRGIAPFSQLHNTFNHPGTAGHQLIANALLRMFPAT